VRGRRPPARRPRHARALPRAVGDRARVRAHRPPAARIAPSFLHVCPLSRPSYQKVPGGGEKAEPAALRGGAPLCWAYPCMPRTRGKKRAGDHGSSLGAGQRRLHRRLHDERTGLTRRRCGARAGAEQRARVRALSSGSRSRGVGREARACRAPNQSTVTIEPMATRELKPKKKPGARGAHRSALGVGREQTSTAAVRNSHAPGIRSSTVRLARRAGALMCPAQQCDPSRCTQLVSLAWRHAPGA